MTTTERAIAHTVTGGGGQSLHVREWGLSDGPSVLLIHGWSGNHLCWSRQAHSELTKQLRLVALDLRGHGMSDQPLDPDQYVDSRMWADDIAAVIDQCHLQRPVLVGWSYGGFIICDYVRSYGEDAISAINLVGGAVTLNESFDNIGPGFLSAAPVVIAPDFPERLDAIRTFWHSITEKPLDAADVEMGLCGTASVPPQVLGALLARKIDSDDVLGRLTVPVLVSHGRLDSFVLPAMAEHVLQLCPTARASWYEGVGHMPFMEDPERFNRELASIAL